MLPLPRTIAVYAPGLSVATIADSKSLTGGMPVAWISSSWVSLQLLLMTVVNPARAVQLEHWVEERIGNAEAGQRRSDGADEHAFGRAARDDEAADANVIAGLHPHPSGEVDRLSR